MFYRVLRPVLFALDAEMAHGLVMSAADVALGTRPIRKAVRRSYNVDDPALRQTVFGIDFDNPVGLAAGFDKNAEHVNPLSVFGFSHIEIGTVTGQAQKGNPRPRLFRLEHDRGLLNRMGFNNHGSQIVSARMARLKPETIVGANIGKTKVVALEDAVEDYETSFSRLFPYARYFVVNVSSPNTPGLRELQNREPLTDLLTRLQELNSELAARGTGQRRPLLVKIAPDLSYAQIEDVLQVAEDCDLDGIVATNTTIEREDLATPGHEFMGSGGVSGEPLRARSLEVIRFIHRQTMGRLPIVGVGGIFTADDALDAIRAGASLVQIWTGFIYEGPHAVRTINRGLLAACREEGWETISDAVGVDASAQRRA